MPLGAFEGAAALINRSDKAVSTAGQRFDKTRARCGIAQRLPNLVDRRIQAVVEIDKGVGRPDLLPQIVAGDHPSGIFKQRGQDLERLFLQPDSGAILAQFAGRQVDFEDAESQ